MTIRTARMDDAAAIADLTRQLGYEVEPTAVADRLSRILERPDQHFAIAEHEGRRVGWIHMVISEYVDSGAVVVIGGLVVDTDHRKRGIGKSLLAYAEEWAHRHGCAVVRLSSSVSRRDAHAFYERAGYKNIKTQYSFVKPLDAIGENAVRSFVPKVSS